MRFAIAIALVCASAQVVEAACDVTTYGAAGDGVADDRPAIQAAIDACAVTGGEVYVPPGTYSIGRAGSAYYGLRVPSGVSLRGANRTTTVLRQVAGLAAGVRLLYLTGDDIALRDITLDGRKGEQSVSEWRHGIFAVATRRLTLERVTARDFTGDGIYLYAGTHETTVADSLATGNDRNGLTMGAQVDGVVLSASRFVGNAVQQVDSEPGSSSTVNDVLIVGCVLDGTGVSNDYALTISGPSATVRSRGWTVNGNTIHGGIFVVWADEVAITGNRGTNPTTKASVTVYRRAVDVVIANNVLRSTQVAVSGVAGIDVVGTGPGHQPERVTIAGNAIRVEHPGAFGVRAMGSISVAVTGNQLHGGGAPSLFGSGVYLRATIESEPFRAAVVRDNLISAFGHYGVLISGNGAARLLSLDISRNVFDDEADAPTMTAGIRVDTTALGFAPSITRSNNVALGGVTLE